MSIERNRPEPAHRVYRGGPEVEHHSFERGFTDFEAHMGMVFPEVRSLDALIEGRLDKARKAGGDVVILDLGAGQGNFTREPLADPTILAKTRKRLAGKTCQTVLKLYSVSDSESPQDHLRVSPFAEAELPGNEQINAHHVNYAVTSTQTLPKLLDGLQEPSADIIVASSFAQYLRPQVFQGLLQDAVDTLKPGGRFMAFGYATVAGRFLSIDDGYAETDAPAVFMDPASANGIEVTGDELRAWGHQVLDAVNTTDDQALAATDRLREIMFASDFYSQPVLGDFRGIVRDKLRSRLAQGELPHQLLRHMLENILPMAEDSERIQIMKQEKDMIIDDIARKNAEVAVVERRRIPNKGQGLDAILIRKRAEVRARKKH